MAEKQESPLGVLHTAPELAPLIKIGGLGDVACALPKALRRQGVDARAVIPGWPGVLDRANSDACLSRRPIGSVSVALNWRVYTAKLWKAVYDGLPVYILDQPELFGNGNVYPERMEPDTVLPFIFLSLASLELPRAIGWTPGVYHSHDWPTAALPAALRWHRHYAREADGSRSVFTIHNLAHQGIIDPSGMDGWGFPPEACSPLDLESMEFYGKLNLMKGALTASGAITTVSPRYSREILTPEYGCMLDGVLRARQDRLKGILNGIDSDVWDPRTDRLIASNYSAGDTRGKAECRRTLLKSFGWEEDGRPVITFVGRLAEQKGVEIMLDALEKLPPEKARYVIIGSGSSYYNSALSGFTAKRAASARAITGFSEEAAHMAYAGSDILLMPSSFEPCGLSQMIACAYGTVPVVRSTGGLADTIFDADKNDGGNGFVFEDYSPDALLGAIYRALDARSSPERWNGIIASAMKKDFSWDASAAEYMELYRSMS